MNRTVSTNPYLDSSVSIWVLCIWLGWAIFCGFNGNEWAWKSKEWQSKKSFHKVQEKWAIVGWILLPIGLLLGFFVR